MKVSSAADNPNQQVIAARGIMLRNRFTITRRVGKANWMARLPLAALAMAVAVAVPARAGEDRSVKLRVAPVYPELAKRLKITGLVKVEANVDPEGRVTAVKTLSGNHALSSAAEDAVSKWRFVAASQSSTVDVDVKFALTQ